VKKVISGSGVDTTPTVIAALAAKTYFSLATLYLLGEPEDPAAFYLTDYETPLVYNLYGTFKRASISRGSIKSKIGLSVSNTTLRWSPPYTSPTSNVNTTSPYHLASLGFYDNWPVRMWTVYMPTPGDANTYGCSELFGGRIASTKVSRGSITFTVNSFLDVVNQMVPTNTIELLNTLAGFRGAVPPPGLSVCPQFNVHAGSSAIQIYGDCTSPTPGQIFSDNTFRNGFLVFNSPGGNTLGRVWASIISSQGPTVGGVQVNDFVLYQPLPWPPTAGVDTFFVSATSPINKDDGQYFGFPYVPNPETGV